MSLPKFSAASSLYASRVNYTARFAAEIAVTPTVVEAAGAFLANRPSLASTLMSWSSPFHVKTLPCSIPWCEELVRQTHLNCLKECGAGLLEEGKKGGPKATACLIQCSMEYVAGIS